MARVTTVCGDIAPEDLGFTSMHDHTFLDMSMAGEYMQEMFPDKDPVETAFIPENYVEMLDGSFLNNRELWLIDDVDLLVHEYDFFKSLGGQSVFAPTPVGLHPNILLDRELSQRTGLNVITTTGFYHETSIPPQHMDQGEEHFYEVMRDQVEHGIDGTDVFPGAIKCALSYCLENETDALNAAFRLGAETGMLVCVHTEPTTPADDLVETIEAAVARYGTLREKVNICHLDNRIAGVMPPSDYFEDEALDRTLDLSLPRELLSLGYNIGLDTWCLPLTNPGFFMPDLFERTKALCLLCEEGYVGQITLGNDFPGASRLCMRSYGGWGPTAVWKFGLERLRELGHEDWIHTLTVETPARLLAY